MRVSLRERSVAWTVKVGEKVIRGFDRYFGRCSLVGDHAFFDLTEFPWVSEIEAGTAAMQRELTEVLKDHDKLPNFQDISTDQYQLTDDDRWKTFFFYGYGFAAKGNIERCPETARLLRTIPGMTLGMFSILSPHKQIPPHGGPYKGVLRYHLGLRIPEPAHDCGIKVRGETRHWKEGGSLVLDDVFEHEAWNNTDAIRVVLFVDFRRPLKGFPNLLNSVIIKVIGWSPFVYDAKVRHRKWEKRFEKVQRDSSPK